MPDHNYFSTYHHMEDQEDNSATLDPSNTKGWQVKI